MTSMTSTFSRQNSLPISHKDPSPSAGILRRRLSFSSMPFPIHPPTISDTTKSVSSASTSIRNWWHRGWGWILSRKPVFAQDLEMNQEEASLLGSHNKGSWRHILYKLGSEIRKLIGSDHATLPQTIPTNGV